MAGTHAFNATAINMFDNLIFGTFAALYYNETYHRQILSVNLCRFYSNLSLKVSKNPYLSILFVFYESFGNIYQENKRKKVFGRLSFSTYRGKKYRLTFRTITKLIVNVYSLEFRNNFIKS